MIASDLAELTNKAKSGGKKIIQAIDETVEDLLTPAGDTGLGIKIKIPRDPVDEIRNDTKSLMVRGREGGLYKGRLRHPESKREPFNWPVVSEDFAENVLRQKLEKSCVWCVGEMLSHGKLTEEYLIKTIKPFGALELLQPELGPPWILRSYSNEELKSIIKRGSFGTELVENANTDLPKSVHSIIVDGATPTGNILIRDPWEGTTCEMLEKEFLKIWSGRALLKR